MTVDELPPPQNMPYLTADLPGVGGRIKSTPDDFLVEELPLYQPSGEGTHTYILIEKRGLTTPEAARRMARALDRQTRDIGYAGLKDKDAVTRQTLSIEHIDSQRVGSLDLSGIKVLTVNRHTNKLKMGHHRGNRFAIKIRDTQPGALADAQAILELLARRGLPNYFGPQRFGVRGDNWLIGHAVLSGDFQRAISYLLGRPGPYDRGDELLARQHYDAGRLQEAADAWPPSCRMQHHVCRTLQRSNGDARQGWRAVDRSMRTFFLSACQSHLFNQVLAERVDGIDRIQAGDLAWKHVNGACFPVVDAVTEQPRCTALEISPSGPIFGRRMTQTTGNQGALEARILAGAHLDLTCFRSIDGTKLNGARRPLRVPVEGQTIEEGTDDAGHFLRLAFSLPPGSYATALTRELCKNVKPHAQVPRS